MIVGFFVFFLGNLVVNVDENIEVIVFVYIWLDSVIWLFLGGFFLVEGMKKMKLD